jgi:hypothetical protein
VEAEQAILTGMAFRFPCYRDLKQKLGEFDALCECIELATRDLIEHASAAPDQHAYVSGLSRLHGIRVNRVDVPALRPHVARMYILAVYQCLEDFLIGLREEHPQGKQWGMDYYDDRLTKIGRAVGFNHTLAFDVCQHYRVIRNATMHPSARDKLRANAVAVKALRDRVAQNSSLSTLDAPNSYDAASFDDFVLFTRSIKTLAEELCAAARPSDDELAEMVKAMTVKLAGKFRNAPERLANARSGFLQTTYSLPKPEADRIIAGLLA